MRRAIVWGAVLGVAFAVALAAAGVFLSNGPLGGRGRPTDEFLFVLEGRTGTAGGRTAQYVAVARADGGRLLLEELDPDAAVSVRGTADGRLRDAYVFGGPKGLSEAVARVRGGRAMPWVCMTEDAWAELVDRAGGLPVALSRDLNVFDGSEVYRFHEGSATLSGAETAALLAGAEQLQAGESGRVRASLVDAAIRAFATDAPSAADLYRAKSVTSSLSEPDLFALGATVRSSLSSVTTGASR